ncbi:carboxypeptidase-like regulatory domain-containing protein [Hymenobacter terrenus]|uniref:carboxypeptidase-like regulatory domain-containing protein n=1 Tax=Hymenobacter terrenus TaxID=1629124 RepID=UPI000619C5F6|nr:carboxypeptidase-like regulatory domain-containing protein [Hymenobacter terrenus]
MLTPVLLSQRFLSSVILSLLTIGNTYAQQLKLAGQILHATTGTPVAYASIGVVGRPIGAVADAQGKFAFTVSPDSIVATEKVIISCVGFQSLEFTVSQLAVAPQVVRLLPSDVNLTEIKVEAQKLKKRIIGNNAKGILYHADLAVDYTGGEVGQIININNHCYLEELNFYVEHNYFRAIKVRLIFYDVIDNLPNSIISNEDILFDISDRGVGWLKIDLRKYNILLEKRDKVAVTLQYISGESIYRKPIFTIPGTFPAPFHTTLHRSKSQDKWDTLKANLSLYFTALCYDK